MSVERDRILDQLEAEFVMTALLTSGMTSGIQTMDQKILRNTSCFFIRLPHIFLGSDLFFGITILYTTD